MLVRLLAVAFTTLALGCGAGPAPVGRSLQFSTLATTLRVAEDSVLQVQLAVLGAEGRSVTFELEEGAPPYASLEGSLITLAPRRGEAGTAPLSVKATAGAESVRTSFTVEVTPAMGSSHPPPPPPEPALPVIDSNFGLHNEDLTWLEYREDIGHYTRGEPRFQLHATDAGGDAFRIFLEVRPESELFQGTATHESGWVASGETVTVPLTGLSDGQRYKVQWRLVDAGGAEMDWYFSAVNVSVWTATGL